MKNRIILFVSLAFFLLFVVIYTNSESDTPEQVSSSSMISSRNSGVGAPAGAPRSSTPNAENVATSYFEKVKQLEDYLIENPSDTTHILRLARLLQEGHQPKQASEWYEKYLELEPNDIQSLLDLANTYGESGNWDKALVVTDNLLKIDPDNGKALYNKAAIHANRGDILEAKKTWELIVKNDLDTEIVQMSKDALEKVRNM